MSTRHADSPAPARRTGRTLGAALLAVAAAVLTARADVVILKDGFVIQGDFRKEKAEVVDKASGRTFVIAKANGFDLVDEGPKLVIFSTHYKQLGDVSKEIKLRPEYRAFRNHIAAFKSQDPLPVGGDLRETIDFNDKWRRAFVYKMPVGVDRVEQQITFMDPYTTYLVSPTHSWRTAYRTIEFGPAKARKLLSTHPELADPPGGVDPARRLGIARFLLDAGWPADARREAEKLTADVPGELAKDARDSLDKLLRDIDRADAEAVVVEAEKAVAAGRYAFAESLLARFPEKGAEPRTAERATRQMATVKAARERYDAAQHLLRDLLDDLPGGNPRPNVGVAGGAVAAVLTRTAVDTQTATLAAAAEAVLAELHPDTVTRIESFVNMARQAREGRVPAKKPVELLAAAVSGWVKGRNSTTVVPEQAVRAWEAREMALAYQRTTDANARRDLLARFRRLTDAPTADELTQVIALLPPPEPENLAARAGKPVPAAGPVPEGVYRRSTGRVRDRATGVEYALRLPPEYQHGRAYPLVVVLTHPGIEPEAILGGLAAEADRNGYVLAAPAWTNGVARPYDYTGDDHVAVTAVLRDAARHISVDTDRVFLFGFGEGANLAADVGASHPDLFAGVAAMGGNPKWSNVFTNYWKNVRLLPYYAVTGELANDSVPKWRALFERWMPRGFGAILVVYKGRTQEWFSAEVPVLFDWMARKRRATGAAALNLNPGALDTVNAWQTMREGDDRFYWLGVGALGDKRRIDTLAPGGTVSPAWVVGDIRTGNQIDIKSNGTKSVTAWLSRDMIDWSLPVKLTYNGFAPAAFKPKKLEPDIEVLMEDFYQRGDKRTLFLYKIDLKAN